MFLVFCGIKEKLSWSHPLWAFISPLVAFHFRKFTVGFLLNDCFYFCVGWFISQGRTTGNKIGIWVAFSSRASWLIWFDSNSIKWKEVFWFRQIQWNPAGLWSNFNEELFLLSNQLESILPRIFQLCIRAVYVPMDASWNGDFDKWLFGYLLVKKGRANETPMKNGSPMLHVFISGNGGTNGEKKNRILSW